VSARVVVVSAGVVVDSAGVVVVSAENTSITLQLFEKKINFLCFISRC